MMFVVLVTQSCPTLCDPTDCSLPGSSIHGISQARILERVTMPSSRGSSWPRDRTHISYVSHSGIWVLYHCCLAAAAAKLLQSCPTLCNTVDWSPPGSSVRGILQTRILEWIAMPSSRGPSQPRDQTLVFCIAGRSFTIWATTYISCCRLFAPRAKWMNTFQNGDTSGPQGAPGAVMFFSMSNNTCSSP